MVKIKEYKVIGELTPEEAVLKDTPVFQAEREECCSRKLVTAKEIWIAGELKYAVILFRHEVFRGRKKADLTVCGSASESVRNDRRASLSGRLPYEKRWLSILFFCDKIR